MPSISPLNLWTYSDAIVILSRLYLGRGNPSMVILVSSWYRLSALQDSTSTLFGVSFIFLLLLLKLLSTHGNRNAPRRCQGFSPDFFNFGLAMIVKPLTYFSCRWSQERSRANTTLNGSIAQRSARSLCTHLKKKGCQLTATEMELMQERATRLSEQDRVALYKKSF